jgi:hypothetical protein
MVQIRKIANDATQGHHPHHAVTVSPFRRFLHRNATIPGKRNA